MGGQGVVTATKLGEELNRSRLHGVHGHGNVGVAGNKDDVDFGFGQVTLKLARRRSHPAAAR
jgi:hypothetical protein